MVKRDELTREKSRRRLKDIFDSSGLTQKEFGESLKRKGYEAPSQQNVQRYLSGESYMPESFAREVVRVYGGRVPYLLGIDDIPTELDEAHQRISAILDKENKREVLFSLLASLQRKDELEGWDLEQLPHFEAPITGLDNDHDSTKEGMYVFHHYATLSRDDKRKVLNRVEYDRLIDKLLAYFDFELENTLFEYDIKAHS